MTVTPQTNATLEEIAETILKSDSLCICGHTSPDGDCIGSGLALREALLQLGKHPSMLLADSDAELEKKFLFLPGSHEYIHARDYKGSCDLFIAVDAPSPDRIGSSAAKILSKANCSITIDHHAHDARMTDLSYTDPDAASTSMIIWELIKKLSVSPNKSMATCALAGLMTDTGSFNYQNADKSAFSAAAEMLDYGASPHEIATEFFQRRSIPSIHLEAKAIDHLELLAGGSVALSFVSMKDIKEVNGTKADCETLINVLRSIDGVRVACMLREQNDSVRGSLRSKDDTDVSALAREFGGGGHKAASGFTMHTTLGCALDTMRESLCKLVDETR